MDTALITRLHQTKMCIRDNIRAQIDEVWSGLIELLDSEEELMEIKGPDETV